MKIRDLVKLWGKTPRISKRGRMWIVKFPNGWGMSRYSVAEIIDDLEEMDADAEWAGLRF